MLHKLLCLLGFHRWEDTIDPEISVWVYTETCRCCGKKRSGWTYYP